MSNQNISLNNKHVQLLEHMKSLLQSIKWSPILSVSAKRRYEVLSAFFFIAIGLFAELVSVIFIYLLIFHLGVSGKLFFLGYLTFMFTDLKADETAVRGQGSKWFRSLSCWRHYANYFPIKLIKTVDLPPTKNYLFACHPHGVIGCGIFGNFATEGTDFHELFPGIRSKLCTLSYHFYVPFFREVVLSWGMMSAKYVSIKHALTQSTNKLAIVNQEDGYTSNAVALVVGGAQEAFNSHPGCYRIYIKNRKGFIKIALETGTSLVPVFSFGEVDVFDQLQNDSNSRLRKFQEFIKRWTGVAPIIFIGRGLFQYSFGIIPRRSPIFTVIGTPIEVEKIPCPGTEDIEKLHEKYVQELEKLFNDHKGKYLKNSESVKLIIE